MCSTVSPSASPAVSPARRSISCRKTFSASRARAGSSVAASIFRAASHREIFSPLARSRTVSTVLAPMPRVGRFTTRSKEASSWRLAMRRREASAALISARSKKSRPPYTREGDAFVDQALLEQARLGVGAVQHRALGARMAARHPVLDAVHHEARLVEIGIAGVELERFAFLARGPQVLAEAAGVVADDRVGGLENGAGGAVVLFETDGAGAGEVVFELA